MIEGISGKRLLMLGANPETAAVVEVAQKMGVYVIVTDYNPEAPAKAVADKAFDVDCMDIDALCELARDEHVDGVMVGVADTLLRPYQQVCERLGLPCYGTAKQMEILSTKDLFKAECERYGIHGVPMYDVSSDGAHDGPINYPVLVKPVDNCSGKGMTVCHDDGELVEGVRKAIESSKSGRYMVERLMECDDLIAYYTIQGGYASLSMLGDRYTHKGEEGGSPVCLADIYPSKYLGMFLEKYDSRFKEMLRNLGVRDGVFLIQMFVEDDECYVYDPGFRLQGGAQHLNIAAVNGFDQREMLVEFALTGKFGHNSVAAMDDVRLRGKTAGSLWLLLRPGTISRVEGVEGLGAYPGIVNVLQRFGAGDEVTVGMQGTEQQVFARLHIVCESREAYRAKVGELMSRIRVFDEHGEDMVLWGDFRSTDLSDCENDLISVIVPIYGVEEYLVQCVESILAQTHKAIEVILVDDGSPDGCGAICDEFAVRDQRVRVVHKENGGLVSARKAGIAMATGTYVGYVDGDDWIEPEFYEVLYDAMQNTGADMVAAGYKEDIDNRCSFICSNGLSCGVYAGERMTEVWANMICKEADGDFGLNTYLWSKLFRRELLEPFQMRVDEHITVGEDAACLYPFVLSCSSVCVISSALYHYRQRSGSMMKGRTDVDEGASGLRILANSLFESFADSSHSNQLLEQAQHFIDALARVRGVNASGMGRNYADLRSVFLGIGDKQRIALCGAGTFGQHTHARLLEDGYGCVAWVDPMYYRYRKLGLNVSAPESLLHVEFDHVLIAFSGKEQAQKAKLRLLGIGIAGDSIVVATL